MGNGPSPGWARPWSRFEKNTYVLALLICGSLGAHLKPIWCLLRVQHICLGLIPYGANTSPQSTNLQFTAIASREQNMSLRRNLPQRQAFLSTYQRRYRCQQVCKWRLISPPLGTAAKAPYRAHMGEKIWFVRPRQRFIQSASRSPPGQVWHELFCHVGSLFESIVTPWGHFGRP